MDYVVIFNERHLGRVLSSYVNYYHRTRTHLALDKDCPNPRPIQALWFCSAGLLVAKLRDEGKFPGSIAFADMKHLTSQLITSVEG